MASSYLSHPRPSRLLAPQSAIAVHLLQICHPPSRLERFGNIQATPDAWNPTVAPVTERQPLKPLKGERWVACMHAHTNARRACTCTNARTGMHVRVECPHARTCMHMHVHMHHFGGVLAAVAGGSLCCTDINRCLLGMDTSARFFAPVVPIDSSV